MLMPPTSSASAPLIPLSSPQSSPRHLESGRVQSGKPVASATYLRPIPTRQPAPRRAALFTLPKEPEDAQITGGTRSLDRRLLALNLAGSRPRTAAAHPSLSSIQSTAA